MEVPLAPSTKRSVSVKVGKRVSKTHQWPLLVYHYNHISTKKEKLLEKNTEISSKGWLQCSNNSSSHHSQSRTLSQKRPIKTQMKLWTIQVVHQPVMVSFSYQFYKIRWECVQHRVHPIELSVMRKDQRDHLIIIVPDVNQNPFFINLPMKTKVLWIFNVWIWLWRVYQNIFSSFELSLIFRRIKNGANIITLVIARRTS